MTITKTPEQRAAISTGMRESWKRRKDEAQKVNAELEAHRREHDRMRLALIEGKPVSVHWLDPCAVEDMFYDRPPDIR